MLAAAAHVVGGLRRSAVASTASFLVVDIDAPPTEAVRSDPPHRHISQTVTSQFHVDKVAFPGGGYECGDSGAVATARHEAEEETGLDPAGVVPLSDLADPVNRLRVEHPSSGYLGPAFGVSGLLVRGFTAGMVSALLDRGGWARPWGTARILDLEQAWSTARADRWEVAGP